VGTRVDQAVRARGGCLGTGRRRRTWQAAKSRGELQASVDPRVSEWGNPAGVMPGHRVAESIGHARRTRGTETSKYPKEEETTVILRVAASERGGAQTVGA
jgi:hypothetical protein